MVIIVPNYHLEYPKFTHFQNSLIDCSVSVRKIAGEHLHKITGYCSYFSGLKDGVQQCSIKYLKTLCIPSLTVSQVDSLPNLYKGWILFCFFFLGMCLMVVFFAVANT